MSALGISEYRVKVERVKVERVMQVMRERGWPQYGSSGVLVPIEELSIEELRTQLRWAILGYDKLDTEPRTR